MRRRRYLKKCSLSETLRLFVEEAPIDRCPAEMISAEEGLGRITADPVHALRSVPHYHAAAMDGVAVRAEDTFGASDARPLELTPASRSGRAPARAAYVHVDTGGTLPRWANAVIMIEHVYPAARDRISIREAARPWQHVRLTGEDVVATELLLPRGHRIRPFDIGALLAAGRTQVAVVRPPRVAILPTGDELVEPTDGPMPPGAIVDFNSRVIAASVRQWGGLPFRAHRLPDDPQRIRAAVRRAVSRYDVVVVIAGSSAGEHDYTVEVLGALGEVLVHGIDIMPGKPAICARVDETPVLGVPGYPVSAVIVCREVLRPLIARFLATAPEPARVVRAVVPRKVPSRLGLEEFVRVSLGRVGQRVVATPLGRGAGAITTLTRADGLLRVPVQSEGLNAGESVDVELLRAPAPADQTIVFSGSHDMMIGLLEDCLRRHLPACRIAASHVGSLAGLIALGRDEAHVVGTHLLDTRTGTYNLPDIRRVLGPRADVAVVHLAVRDQGLVVRRRNPKHITGLRDLVREDVRFVNRQAGAGTRVLLDAELRRLKLRPRHVLGYDREEYTHMAVASAVASGLADCGLAIRSAARALGLSFVPVAREDYDLVLRRDFAESSLGKLMFEVIRSREFRAAVRRLGGYHVGATGTIKALARAGAR